MMEKAQITGQLAWWYILGILGLKRNDVLLPAFPKTGSTWVRFLVCNLISLSELEGREVDFHFVSTTMPSLGRSNLLEPWPFKTMPRFVKTHKFYWPLLFVRPRRVVYILRDPRDVMVSYYHYLQARLQRPFHGDFAELIRHPSYGLDACLRHYFSWLPHVTVVIRYEALKQDTVAELRRLLTALQTPLPDELLRLAIERSSIEQMRLAEEKSGLAGPQRFELQFRVVRKGTVKQWPEYFSDEDLALYDQVCQAYGFDLYPNLNKLVELKLR